MRLSGELQAALETELFVDRVQVRLHRAFGDEEFFGELAVAEA